MIYLQSRKYNFKIKLGKPGVRKINWFGLYLITLVQGWGHFSTRMPLIFALKIFPGDLVSNYLKAKIN